METKANTDTAAAYTRAVSKDSLNEAAYRLRQGHLVAFPTETVYGLGAHALDADAVHRIFAAKERPLTDPVIVHVLSLSDALTLFDLPDTGNAITVINILGKTFWPGPLTIVSRAAAHVPSVVCAGSGYVGTRVPVHPVARSLIQHAQLPVAAPSANRFGHISPTCASHVFSDLKDKDVMILEDDSTAGCEVGIESTVIKVDENSSDGTVSVHVLRRGGVPLHVLRETIAQQCPPHTQLILNSNNTNTNNTNNNNNNKSGSSASFKDEDTPQIAPGQLLRHYAPDCPTFLTLPTSSPTLHTANNSMPTSESAVIDFGGMLKVLGPHCRWYADLSPEGNVDDAARHLFATLREAESQEGVSSVILPDLGDRAAAVETGNNVDQQSNVDALHDRLFRSASGKRAVISQDGKLLVEVAE